MDTNWQTRCFICFFLQSFWLLQDMLFYAAHPIDRVSRFFCSIKLPLYFLSREPSIQ